MAAPTYGSDTALSGTTGWEAQADGDFDVCSWVDNTTNKYHGVIVEITLDTGASAPAAGTFWGVWLTMSFDGTVVPTVTAPYGVLLGTMAADVGANTNAIEVFNTGRKLDILPPHWAIGIANHTGTTTGNTTVKGAYFGYQL